MAAKKSGLNISKLTQEALRSALAADSLKSWQDGVNQLAPTGIDHETVLSAVSEARDEFDRG